MSHDPQVLQKVLDKAVLGLFKGKHYSGFLMTIYCGLKFSWNDAIGTACVTKSKRLIISPTWFLTLTERSRVALLAHELWHIAFMHLLRVGNRKHRLWNQAADHAINLMLIQHGYHFDMPYLGDRRFMNLSAEQIYTILDAENAPDDLPFGEDFAAMAPDEDPSQEIPDDQAEAAMTALIVRASTVEAMATKPGTLPGGLQEIIDQLLNPSLPWERIINRWLTARSEIESNWRRPNRRYRDIYLPSRGGDNGLAHLMWGFDTSCSMTPRQLLKCNSEMAGAYDQFQPDKMTVVTFDTEIQQILQFGRDKPLERLIVQGRGGTNMQPIFDLAAETRPDALIMFSDMECRIPEAIRGIEVLWVCLDNKHWVPPYGDVVHIDSRTPTTA